MNDYEKHFIARMGQLHLEGKGFEALVGEATTSKFGGAAEVILRDLSPSAVQNPKDFVRELSKTFGRGAIGIFEPILKHAELGLFPSKPHEPGVAELIGSRLERSGEGGSNPKETPLHEHRVKDEQGNYPDEAQ